MAGVGERNAVAVRVSAGDATAACWTADWSRGVKPIEFHPRLGHRIEVRCADNRVAIEPHVPPAKVVAHNEHDVGLLSSQATTQSKCDCDETKQTLHAATIRNRPKTGKNLLQKPGFRAWPSGRRALQPAWVCCNPPGRVFAGLAKFLASARVRAIASGIDCPVFYFLDAIASPCS